MKPDEGRNECFSDINEYTLIMQVKVHPFHMIREDYPSHKSEKSDVAMVRCVVLIK